MGREWRWKTDAGRRRGNQHPREHDQENEGSFWENKWIFFEFGWRTDLIPPDPRTVARTAREEDIFLFGHERTASPGDSGFDPDHAIVRERRCTDPGESRGGGSAFVLRRLG